MGDGYLDSASSEPLHPAAREAMLAALDRGYADPRRLHSPARDARLLLDNAREVVAEALGVRRDEVSFTSSGTDAVHRGLLGMAGPGTTVAHSAVEHSSVLHALAWRPDIEARSVRVDATGRVDLGDLGTPDVVALQAANHEVGTLQPVAVAAGVAPVFMDACASMGRLPLPEGWSVAAGSAHKWGGPAGVGVLLVRKGVVWRNPFPADDRADERVSGFENVPAALAAAAALQAVVAERDAGQRASARDDRPDPRPPSRRSPTPRSSAIPMTGSPTWSRSRASTSTARRWSTRSTDAASRSPAARPAPRPPWSPATCWRRWARSPMATSGSR